MNFTDRMIAPRYHIGSATLRQVNPQADHERKQILEKFSDGRYAFHPRSCMFCSGEDFDVLASHDRYGLPICTTICTACGLIQTNPDMREEDYRDFYLNHYRRLYIADLVGSPQEFFNEERWRGQKILKFLLARVALPPNALVVEIGCGAGGILHEFSQKGFRVIGTDLGKENLAYGQSIGMDLRHGDLFDLELPEAPSLIIYSHVLEHIQNPARTLKRIRELLGEDGHLYIEVPGVKDVRNNVFQGDFLRMFHVAHIYNFSFRSLQNLMGRHGFSLVSGDEYIRSIFKRGPTTDLYESDYEEVIQYIRVTERNRRYYRTAFFMKSALRAVVDTTRRTLIHGLRRIGMYDAVKRALG